MDPHVPVFVPAIGVDTVKAVTDAFHVGWLGMGALTKEFEEKVAAYLDDQPANAVVTGLLFIDPNAPDMHELGQSSPTPLRDLAYEKLCPGSAELERMQEEFR